MIKLLFISDFTEQFSYKLLKGILQFSRTTEPWIVKKVSPCLAKQLGYKGIVDLAVEWNADIVIGRFEPDEDLSVFTQKGIVVIAQDYKQKFKGYTNITGDDFTTGRIAADYYIKKGFRHFAFFGYKDVCWSRDRYHGFKSQVCKAGYGEEFYMYDDMDIDNNGSYDYEKLLQWLQSLPKPVAIFACDDNLALVLLEVGNVSGMKIPFEISVLGVDNDEILCNLCNPPLSSIKIDIERGGYCTAVQAVKMIHNKIFTGTDITLEPIEVVSRGSTSAFATSDQLVLKALAFIKANIHHRINVKDVLKAVPLSRRLLEIRFKKVTGTTIYNYISVQRMDYFAELLLTTKDTVTEIALNMDEVDVKSISRRFKSIIGCTPTEYREKKHYANCD